ncbi:MAG TPA: hypothetical protein VK194_00690, partial [Candidatus Deferrimicrobium sp.]|nr:hypothetical protein [Candidatus Deferrimicrobium sp.]
LAAAYVALSWLSYRHGDYGTGLAILEEALEVLPPDAAVARSRVRCEIGWSLLRLRRRVESEAELRATLSVAEAEHDRLGVMRALDGLGCAEAAAGRIDVSVDHLERALSIAVELGDGLQEVITRIHLVTSLTAAGRFAVARRHAVRTLEVGRLMGDRYIESVAARQAAELEDAAGSRAAAGDLRRRELRLLEELGGNPRNEAWAHAHLAVIARAAGDEATVETESAAARRLAHRSPTPDDADWIETALAASRWADVPER